MYYKIQKTNNCLTITISEYRNLVSYRCWFIPKILYPDTNIQYVFYYNIIQSNKYVQFLIDNQIIINQPYKYSLCKIFTINPILLLELL